jgi:hypothetical protein
MSRNRRRIVIYLIVGLVVTIIFRSARREALWHIETLMQWWVSFFAALGIDAAWEGIGR